MKMHRIQHILARVFLEGWATCSPSPLPSPLGRGGIVASLSKFPGVPASRRRSRPFSLPLNLGSPEGCRRFPLSPSEGERAGVRGPTWGSGTQSASECRGILSPKERAGARGKTTSDRLWLPMYPNFLARTLATTFPALLSLTLALGARAATNSTTGDISSVVPFELGEGEFLPGDSITIQRVSGTSSTIQTGQTYCVEGTYTLASKDQADLALYATTKSAAHTPTYPSQIMRIEKGTGTFRLVKTMREEGYLHVSFYPVPAGSAFGGIYFGQGNWVLRHKGWSYLDTHARSPDYVTTGSPAGGPVSLAGPNQALYEYLGNPVAPPSDMNVAYSKDGLIKAVQTAARNAGVSVTRVEIDDSEFPFLVGVTCQEGDWENLKEQFRKMPDYSHTGGVGGHTHYAFNLVPYSTWPSDVSQRISHRTGLRMQVLYDKLTRLQSR